MDANAAFLLHFMLVTHTSLRAVHFKPVFFLGLIHTAGRAEPNRTVSAWKTNLRYEMEVFTLHAELNRTVPDRACSLADVCFCSPADDRFCCAVGLTSCG